MSFTSAFQTSAFQRNAFQIADVVAGGVIQPAGQFSRSRWRKITEEEARRKLEAQQQAEWKAERERVAAQLKRDTEKKERIAARNAKFAKLDEESRTDALARAGIAANQVHASAQNLTQLGLHSNAIDQMAAQAKADQDEEEEMLMLLEVA